jgi:hypothetical protein
MATDRSNDPAITLTRILRERLEQYNVPGEVQAALRKEILAFMGRPERKPSGAVVMTPEASIAADKAKQEKRSQTAESPKPRII